ncbi:DUF2922 domain-containing protein [Enterococcus hermanniensis]|uniref:Uncharacterized protein n=1 Tax=Enterococcus hermanniensis TaxID=249189 RepID=A0A1L8TRX1_9ENTE|nr:DUF2922 domain-containing protein [Enterococcus hermanniensis]OJG47065.1 hypothetical protein RV04_GL000312 [Enterococcus hermanniensis]
MLKLAATFANNEGKAHQWNFSEPNRNLSSNEIQTQLEMLCTVGLFEKEGKKLYDQVTSAKYIETIETPIF